MAFLRRRGSTGVGILGLSRLQVAPRGTGLGTHPQLAF